MLDSHSALSVCIKLHPLNPVTTELSTSTRFHLRIHGGSRIAQPILDEIWWIAGCSPGKQVCWYSQLSEQQEGREHNPSAREDSSAATGSDILLALTLSPVSKAHPLE